MDQNPFSIAVYQGPDHFCDRENELSKLRETLMNGSNMLLYSPRRMGKTGLIRHLFQQLAGEPLNTIHVDVFGTGDLNDCISAMATAVIHMLFPVKGKIPRKALKLFGNIRPQITYNAYGGTLQLSFSLQNQSEQQAILKDTFALLEKQKVNNILALDEFQQISRYPEKNTEELLRSLIQPLQKTQLIFSGSQRNLLFPMFFDPKRAFYQSSGYLSLGKLEHDHYQKFIIDRFKSNHQGIAVSSVDYILEWTKRHTFYTQYLCNRVFSKRQSHVTKELILHCIREIITEREPVFYNFRNLLSHHQYRLLSAIAREEGIAEPTGQRFLKKYDLGNASTVRKSLQALIEKEMIYQSSGEEKPYYEVCDVFLARWFSRKAGIS